MTRVWPQPMIAVRDVPASSRFYTQVLGADSGHGGTEYEQIVIDGEIVLQLHKDDAADHHGLLANPNEAIGNGLVLWFEVADFDAAVEAVRATGAQIVTDVHINPNAQQQEIWVRDPNGFLLVLAGESPYRPRS